jgi:sugar lactone lactonase YvrE
VIVPSNVIQRSSVFGGVGAFDFTDLSSLTGKALKIGEIQRLLQRGNKIGAIKVFRETFGVSLKEAKDAVEAMERGESVDISGMQIQSSNLRTGFHPNPEALKVAKKVGVAVGGSIIGITIVTIVLILGATLAAFFIISNSIDRAVEKKPETRPVVTNDEKPRLAEEVLKFGGEGTGAGRFKDNRSVAVAPDGKIYSCDFSGGRVQVFDAGGKFLTQWNAGERGAIRDLKADRRGNIYIATSSGISVFEGETGRLVQKLENTRAEGLAVTLDGRIVAAGDRGVTVYDSALKPLQEFKDVAESASAVFNFQEIAVDGNGVMFMVDRQNGDLCKFSAEGKFLNRYKTGITSPNAIAIDNKGRIFLSDTSSIHAFDADGKEIESFPATQAFGIAFNDADELFVASRPFVVKYKLNF